MATSAPVYPVSLPIPIDLFVSKKHPGLTGGDRGFADSAGNLVFRVSRDSYSNTKPSHRKRLLLDASGNTLISIYRHDNGSWRGFKGGDDGEKSLIFRVQRTLKNLTRTELEVFLVGENLGESTSDFKVKGCPFQRSCTIYRGGSILAQTSLMYKLNQIFVGRSKFRLTIFPGTVDYALIVSLLVIFLDSKK